MSTVLSVLAQAIFYLIIAFFVLYVLLELRALRNSRKAETRQRLTPLSCEALQNPENFDWPTVSILLPVYNESEVIERLIDAICQLTYPNEKVEILVLDDSTDETSDLAIARVARYFKKGKNIRILRRNKRRGYKAGNLMRGIQNAQGDFFVIFDADFVPPQDFLLRTIPRFENPKLGYLQTGIGYENRDVSFLTRFQAMEMGHQQVVTVGLDANGDMASLSGSSCVWRRDCVESLGGWSASTITEDTDLGYRAQLGDWEYVYMRDVMSMSILPESTEAFRVQRERWGRGLLHSAFRHVHKMFQQRMPLMRRMHALSMMFSSLLLASVYVLLLLCLPLSYLVSFEDFSVPFWVALVFYVFVAIWGLSNISAAKKGAFIQERFGLWRTLWSTYVYVSLFLPMAWYYFVGGIRALMGVHGQFYRTPKGHAGQTHKAPPIHRVLLIGDAISFVISGLIVLVSLKSNNYFLIPVGITGMLGFGLMLQGWWRERRERAPHTAESD